MYRLLTLLVAALLALGLGLPEVAAAHGNDTPAQHEAENAEHHDQAEPCSCCDEPSDDDCCSRDGGACCVSLLAVAAPPPVDAPVAAPHRLQSCEPTLSARYLLPRDHGPPPLPPPIG